MAEACLHAKFHLDLSNRLATIHQRHRQTGQDRTEQTDRQTDRQTTVRQHRANRFTNGRPKTCTSLLYICAREVSSSIVEILDLFRRNLERKFLSMPNFCQEHVTAIIITTCVDKQEQKT